jgi:hypothetical protein
LKVDDGALLAGLVSVAVFIVVWPAWYADVFRVNRLAAPRAYRLLLGLSPVACLLFLLLCLDTLAAKAVRESGLYKLIYVVMGAAVLGVTGQLASVLGVSARDDVLERRNGSSLIAVVGALLGATLCFAGGNIGEEPGFEVVIISSGTALCTWFVLWYLAELLSGRVISERITVERDPGSGIRLAGLLAGNGVILGAAVAGHWTPGRLLHDFALSAWPALALTVVAALIERISKSRSSVWRSVLLVFGYLVIAVAWAIRRGFGA